CASGLPGDAEWSTAGRSGCFLDENGTANVRATCGSTYVGVLGRDDIIDELYRWTWRPRTAQQGSAPPGICASGTGARQRTRPATDLVDDDSAPPVSTVGASP